MLRSREIQGALKQSRGLLGEGLMEEVALCQSVLAQTCPCQENSLKGRGWY